jgi:hypothetical protein
MSEAALWATMRGHVRTFGHFERIENMVGVGRPDVNYCVRGVEGNIELKHAMNWPRRPETPLPLPHYTPQQRNWQRDRERAGGRVYVLLEVERPKKLYMLFTSEWARLHLGLDATRRHCLDMSIVFGSGAFPTSQLIAALTALPFTFRASGATFRGPETEV